MHRGSHLPHKASAKDRLTVFIYWLSDEAYNRETERQKEKPMATNDKVLLIHQPNRSEVMSVFVFCFSTLCHTEPDFRLSYLFFLPCCCLVESSEVLDSIVWFDQCESNLSVT